MTGLRLILYTDVCYVRTYKYSRMCDLNFIIVIINFECNSENVKKMLLSTNIYQYRINY